VKFYLLFPNIFTLSQFQGIYYLSLFHDFVLNSL